ncbi:MAG: LytTR family transcriptional regulator, partial [Psychrosphaera sp.]|nr:LytTR family transcriptional regulator [Psychrosphaera sp.]
PVPISGWPAVLPVFLVSVLATGMLYLVFAKANAFILTCGLSVILTGSFIRGLSPKLLPQWFGELAWTVQRQIVFESVYFGCIGLVLLLVAVSMNVSQLNVSQLLIFVGLTFVLGSLPLSFKVLLTQNILLKRNIRNMQSLIQQHHDPAPDQESKTVAKDESEQVTLKAITNDSLTVKLSQLLFVKAQQSYCEVYWLAEGETQHYLLRQNISKVRQQLADTPIYRSHRSFLVNINQVAKVSGNAQGYLLHLASPPHAIALSRSKAGQILPLLAHLD